MFTGIVEEIGTIVNVQRIGQSANLHISATEVLADAKIGDSIAVDGACLTVRSLSSSAFIADVSAETLRRTTLGKRKPRERVNLERSLRLSDRLGGHLVLGHIDDVATISGWKDEDYSSIMQVEMNAGVQPYIAYKGSVSIDGVSLTIANVYRDVFEVALIPYTKDTTTLGAKSKGERVNVEVDVVARYVETLLLARTRFADKDEEPDKSARLDMEFLAQHGFF